MLTSRSNSTKLQLMAALSTLSQHTRGLLAQTKAQVEVTCFRPA